MSIKISELPQATSVSSNDIVPIVQGGTTKQADISKFSNASSVPMGATFQYDGDTIPTGYEEVNGLETYSTTEQKVGTWINGKPLYRKVITGQTPTVSSDGTEASTTVTLSNGETSNTDHYAIVNGWVRYANSPYSMWTMPYYNNSMRYVKSLMNTPTGGNLNLQVSSNGTVYNSCTFTCVVEYTKSTDSAS